MTNRRRHFDPYKAEMQRQEDLRAFNRQARIITNTDEGSIAMACRVAGHDNFAIFTAELGLWKRYSVLDHLRTDQTLLIACPAALKHLWQECAEEAGHLRRHVTVVSREWAARHALDQFGDMADDAGTVIIEEPKGDASCLRLGKGLKMAHRVIYMSSIVANEPIKELNRAAVVTGRSPKKANWVIVAKSNLTGVGGRG